VSDCEEIEGLLTGDDVGSHPVKNPQSISKIVPARQTSVSALKI